MHYPGGSAAAGEIPITTVDKQLYNSLHGPKDGIKLCPSWALRKLGVKNILWC